jgi:hypothetical protein
MADERQDVTIGAPAADAGDAPADPEPAPDPAPEPEPEDEGGE